MPQGLGEFVGLGGLRSSVLGVGSTQVTKFLQMGSKLLLAGALSSGVRLDRRRDRLPEPWSWPRQITARNLPAGHGALRKSHGLLAELLPEVGEVKFIQEDVGENDKVK